MHRKPWPIILLSLFYFIVPIFNYFIGYARVMERIPFKFYFSATFSSIDALMSVIHMSVPSILAGIAIYMVRSWSYPVFLMSMAWVTTRIIYNYAVLPELYTFSYIIVPMIVNIFLVSYILLPNVRAAYYIPRIRWWETKPRFKYFTDATVIFDDQNHDCMINDIAEGGVFISATEDFLIDQQLKFKVKILGYEIESEAKITHKKEASPQGYGVQFLNISKELKLKMQRLCKQLENEKHEITRPIPIWTEDLINWVKTLFTTGKGMTPNIPDHFKEDH